MVKNVGPADKFIRFMIGISFLLNIIILEPGIVGGLVLLILGCGMLFSTFTGFCWAYKLLNISTCGETCAAPSEDAPAN